VTWDLKFIVLPKPTEHFGSSDRSVVKLSSALVLTKSSMTVRSIPNTLFPSITWTDVMVELYYRCRDSDQGLTPQESGSASP
jgi:hypothetical protein